MNYYKSLYDITAALLLYTNQTENESENTYSVAISRYIYENSHHWDNNESRRYIDTIGILLSLERNPVSISENVYTLLKSTIDSISDEYILENYSEEDVKAVKKHIEIARSVLDYYGKNE